MNTYEKAVKLFKARPELVDVAFHEVNHYSESALAEQMDELFDESMPEVAIAGYTYSPAQALRAIDPIAYHQELLAYIDNMDVVEIDGRYYDEAELLDFIEQHTNSEVV